MGEGARSAGEGNMKHRRSTMKKVFSTILVTLCAAFGCSNLLNDARDAVNTDVYIAGATENSGIYIPCYWKNNSRIDLEPSDSTDQGFASGIYVAGESIYIAGYITLESVRHPCYWKNGVRTDLSIINIDEGGAADSVVESAGDVYVGGYVADASSGNEIACYWKNSVRSDMEVLAAGKRSPSCGMYVSGSDVYLAGFSTNSSNYASHVTGKTETSTH